MSNPIDKHDWIGSSAPGEVASGVRHAEDKNWYFVRDLQSGEMPQTRADLNNGKSPSADNSFSSSVRRRQIQPHDLGKLAGVLHSGFPTKTAATFLLALYRLALRSEPTTRKTLGFVIEAGSEIVGVLLTIFSNVSDASPSPVRCNISCWYVAPEFRMYAPLLLLGFGRNPEMTLINISPASSTIPTIEAQGFIRYSQGAFAGVPAIALRSGKLRIRHASRTAFAGADLAPHEITLLRDHGDYGCLSLICTDNKRSFPLIVRRFVFRRFPVPCARLIYIRDMEDLSRFAGAIGRFLAMRGMFWMCIATPTPLRNIPGKFFSEKFPMYSRGLTHPSPGDLAYTEAAVLGF